MPWGCKIAYEVSTTPRELSADNSTRQAVCSVAQSVRHLIPGRESHAAMCARSFSTSSFSPSNSVALYRAYESTARRRGGGALMAAWWKRSCHAKGRRRVGALDSYPPCVAEEVVNRPLRDFTTVRRKPVFNASKSSDAVIRALYTFMTVNDRRRADTYPMARRRRLARS